MSDKEYRTIVISYAKKAEAQKKAAAMMILTKKVSYS